MNIDDLTVGQIKQIQALNLGVAQPESANSTKPAHPYEIGQNYSVRTVTMIYTGKLVAVYPEELVLIEAAWIADTARWADFVATGEHNECEPYPSDREVIVPRVGYGSLDVVRVDFKLPSKQK